MQNVLVSPDRQVFSRLAITEVHDSNKSFHSLPESILEECYPSSLGNAFTWLASPSLLPSLLQIQNLKHDPILSLGARKRRRLLTRDPGRHPSVPGSPGKEMELLLWIGTAID